MRQNARYSETVKCHAVLLLVVLCGSIVLSQTVKVDWTRGTDFKTLQTYAWNTSPSPAKEPFWDQKIVSLIDSALLAKGLQRVDVRSKPDMVVTYSAALKDDALMMGWQGRLEIKIRVPQGPTIWHGVATDVVFDKSHKNMAAVEKMVAKMFNRYPPDQ